MDNTTLNLEDWSQAIAQNTEVPTEYGAMVMVHAGEFLEPVLSGFMAEPVGKYNGCNLEVTTVIIEDIVEFRENLATDVFKGKSFFLYMPIWIPKMPIFKKIDSNTYNIITCDPPEWINGKWKIKFATLDA